MPVEFTQDQFGVFTDPATGETSSVRRFTWKSSNNVSVQLITYGATITSIKMPDKKGKIDDIVLGFNDMDGYLNPLNPYFGATIGRAANRIANGKMTIEGETFEVARNKGKFTLHGGFRGFDKVNWNFYVKEKKVILSHFSADKDEGFPGDLIATVAFELTDHNELTIEYKTTTSKPTYVNMTNHSYFNLAGHHKGAVELYKHEFALNADRVTEVDEDLVSTGGFIEVADTPYDLRVSKVLGNVIDKLPNQGFDNNYCIVKGEKQDNAYVGRVFHPGTGRVLEVYSNQPGVQFYTGNSLPQDPKLHKGDPKDLPVLTGKNVNYYRHGAFCLETQNYPDAINHSNFPNAVLYPGDTYLHTVSYAFGVRRN